PKETLMTALKRIGGVAAVLAVLWGGPTATAGEPAADAALSLWVQREYTSWDNPLHSELSVNDQMVGTFTSDTDRAIGEHLKPGWNTIMVKTAPQPGATKNNQLIFRVGTVTKKDGKR